MNIITSKDAKTQKLFICPFNFFLNCGETFHGKKSQKFFFLLFLQKSQNFASKNVHGKRHLPEKYKNVSSVSFSKCANGWRQCPGWTLNYVTKKRVAELTSSMPVQSGSNCWFGAPNRVPSICGLGTNLVSQVSCRGDTQGVVGEKIRLYRDEDIGLWYFWELGFLIPLSAKIASKFCPLGLSLA